MCGVGSCADLVPPHGASALPLKEVLPSPNERFADKSSPEQSISECKLEVLCQAICKLIQRQIFAIFGSDVWDRCLKHPSTPYTGASGGGKGSLVQCNC